MSNAAINDVDIIKKVFDMDDISDNQFSNTTSRAQILSHNDGTDRLAIPALEWVQETSNTTNSLELFPLPTGFKVVYLISYYYSIGWNTIPWIPNSTARINDGSYFQIGQIKHGVVTSDDDYKLTWVGGQPGRIRTFSLGSTVATAAGLEYPGSISSKCYFAEAPFIENQETAYFAGIRTCLTMFNYIRSFNTGSHRSVISASSGFNYGTPSIIYNISRLKIYALRIRIA